MKPDRLLPAAALALSLLFADPSAGQTAGGQSSAPGATYTPAELLQRLRAGGYTIHFRHAVTDASQGDDPAATASTACAERGECGDCSKQRNLSAAGRAQAREVGAAIRALDIPIGSVLAGPLCRTRETARLMFGRTEVSPDVRGGGLGRPSYPGLLRLLSTPVPPGTNHVLSGHGGQFEAVAGAAFHLEQGEAAVVRGLANGRFEVVARIRSGDWGKLKLAGAGA